MLWGVCLHLYFAFKTGHVLSGLSPSISSPLCYYFIFFLLQKENLQKSVKYISQQLFWEKCPTSKRLLPILPLRCFFTLGLFSNKKKGCIINRNSFVITCKIKVRGGRRTEKEKEMRERLIHLLL